MKTFVLVSDSWFCPSVELFPTFQAARLALQADALRWHEDQAANLGTNGQDLILTMDHDSARLTTSSPDHTPGRELGAWHIYQTDALENAASRVPAETTNVELGPGTPGADIAKR